MLLFSLLMLLPLQAVAPQENAQINCAGRAPTVGELSQAAQSGVAECSGGAVVDYQDLHVESNWMKLDNKTKILTAGDQVRFKRGGEELTGGQLSYNIDTKTGTLTDVSGQIEGWYLKAGDYERLADGKWHLRRISATACVGDCPSWRFTFKEATVTPGERVAGKNVVFRFRNVPLFYFPRFSVPTGTRERSSGFLVPSLAKSTSKGRSISETFYWAINRSYDAFLTGEYFSERGPAGSIDFRGIPNPTSGIEVNTLFATDRTPADQGGYRTRIRTYSGLANGWRAMADIDATSSFVFRQVYEEGFNNISSPIVQSVGFLYRNGPKSSLGFLYDRSAIFFPNQTKPSVVLRRAPSVDLQLPTNEISGGSRIPVYFSLDGGFTGMARMDPTVDTPTLWRFDVHPSLMIPVLRSNWLTWSHQLGVRETLYTHSLDPTVDQNALSRGSFDYGMRITGPQLEKSFGSWRHILEPTFDYRFVGGIDEFRKTVIVDENDLIANTNEIEYGITNHLIGGREFLFWRVAQKMYFDPTFGGALLEGHRNTLAPLMDITGFAFSDGEERRFSPIVSTMRISTTPQTSTDIEVDYDTERKEFRSAGIMGNLNRGVVNSSIGYFFNTRTQIQLPRNQLGGLLTFRQGKPGVSAGFGFYYDIQRSFFQGSTAQVSYNAQCYGLNFEFSQVNLGNRIESRVRFSLMLKNIGSIGTLRPQERLF
jgi:LPS-assembly protein